MPVLEERARFASTGGVGEPCHCWGIGRALSVLGGEGTSCQCWGRGRTLLVLGDWVHLANDGEEDAPW